MLRHYLDGVGKATAMSSVSRNPYATAIVPLAFSDDMLMHCITALGGATLSCRKQDRIELEAASGNHYSKVLQGLHAAVGRLRPDDLSAVLRVLVILVVAASYEVGSVV
jgi:hypothetical protein